ncbi:hypothetical protein BD626DRAFT_493180 [Schizophyllum amplum]|uniref:Uncharacterized protein n=1 Tax=Schizophyllum amplum TaxID=97359 RepID=A0A550CGI8_9AGAR|nr:hypothetical protein BD626DRAFT_493180 [Auriculariopsis ampla]
MCGVAELSPAVLNAITIYPGQRNLLPHLQHLTFITDASPETELEFESNSLADFIESRVSARQLMTKAEAGGGGQLVENLKIFRLACQEDHLFCWCKKMRKRRARWLKQGLKMAMAVVDIPTQFIDLTDHGEFTGDWEWLV